MKTRKIITYPVQIETAGASRQIQKELPAEAHKITQVAMSSNRMDLAHYRGKCSLRIGPQFIINDGEDVKDYARPFDFGEVSVQNTDRQIRFSYQDIPTDGTTFPTGGYTVQLKIYYQTN